MTFSSKPMRARLLPNPLYAALRCAGQIVCDFRGSAVPSLNSKLVVPPGYGTDMHVGRPCGRGELMKSAPASTRRINEKYNDWKPKTHKMTDFHTALWLWPTFYKALARFWNDSRRRG